MDNPQCLREAEEITQLSDIAFVNYLIEINLIPRFQTCQCGRQMNIEKNSSSSDGVSWRCTHKYCRKFKTIKTGSVFENCGYNLKQCFRIYSAWAANFRQMDIAQYIGVKDTHVIGRLCKIFRDKCSEKYIEDLTSNPLGSTGGLIQIDESATGKAKFHRGRALKRECMWVAGAVDNETNRVAVEQIPNRTQKTLTKFVQDNVQAQSTIHTDNWRSYNNLSSLGYNHDTVNHSVEFVKENDDGTVTHTQKVEGNWTSMKKYIKHHSAHHRAYTNSYVQNWAYRRNVGNSFNNCFNVIKDS